MKRLWMAISLLAASWMFGLGYYQSENWYAWALLVGAGLALLAGREEGPAVPVPDGAGGAALLLLPAALAPWPYRMVPMTLAAGLALRIAPVPRRWPRRLGAALTEGGLILGAQAAAFWAYAWLTAWSHELPGLGARAIAALARLLGIGAAYNGTNVALFSMRKMHALAPTWELALDPVTAAFLAGGAAALAWRGRLRGLGRLAAAVALWLPLRCGLLLGILLHRALLTDYDAPLRLMNQFWSPWVLLALLAGPAGLAARFVGDPGRSEGAEASAAQTGGRRLLVFGAAALGAFVFCGGLFWDPPGARKPGRVLMDEFHSTWEPTSRPFDTTWYGHEAGYNYACIYDYCSRFYDLGRQTSRLDEAALEACDVLILKVPTGAYEPEELAAVERFVERGGGVMLVGEHTDVFLTSTHLNQVARLFGFEFRKDCLFGIHSPFDQRYEAPLVPHPVVQWMPPFEFAVSCSIRPHAYRGRAVMRAAGLWSLPADYHASNFYPQVEDRADARYGAFIQLWAVRRGAGRVLAFTDSTVFSNFSAFEPGRTELMLGMIEWLNHRNRGPDPRPWLLGAGGVLWLLALTGMGGRRWLPPLAALTLFGWAGAVLAVRAHHPVALPLPAPRRPLTEVVVDRTLSDAPLSKCGFIKASPEGFGIFEQWILRLGYFTARREGARAFEGRGMVILEPDRLATEAFRTRLVDYVKRGGRVLVVDSALSRQSTVNSLLHPFGLSVDMASDVAGVLEPPAGWPAVPVESVRTVNGGEPLFTVAGQPVGARAGFGQGAVVLIGFGARFNDDHMGITTDIEPDAAMRQVYELEFRLLRHLMEETADGDAS